MEITCLVNNFSQSDLLKNEHGLSLYIKSDNLNILFDTGLEEALFCNAKILGINLEDLDYIILSHSHNDHTGALKNLLSINKKAKVLAHRKIFTEKYSKSSGDMKFIGLKEEGLDLSRFYFVEDSYILDNNIEIIGNLKIYKNSREKTHFIKENEVFLPDYASDEIYLIIKNTLITGCSHRGILNIIEELKEKKLLSENFVIIGGLHTRSKSKEEMLDIAKTLRELGAKEIYANHCSFMDDGKSYDLKSFTYFYTGNKLIF